MNALLIDLDGVIYEGDQVVPGAREAIAWLTQEVVPHLFLTNTTSRPREALVSKLAGLDIPVNTDDILTPPVAATTWLRAHDVRVVSAFVPETTRSEFEGFELMDGPGDGAVDAVVIGDLGEGWDFATLNRAFLQLMHEPQPYLVALGMTRYWRASDGLRLDTAPFVVALAHASGVSPTVLGKPAAPFFHAALRRIGATPEHTFMVGDDPKADIEGARDCGMRGILVRTGKCRGADVSDDVRAFAVIDSIADLPLLLEKRCS